MNTVLRSVLLMMLLFVTAGCSRDVSLQGAFEKQMRKDRMDGFNIVHLEENEADGLVLYTAWTKEYPDNKKRPGILYFQKGEAGWESKATVACSGIGVSSMNLMGNAYLFCSTLKEYMEFEKILVGDSQATVFQVSDKIRVWYAIEDEKDSHAKGVTEDGQEVLLE